MLAARVHVRHLIQQLLDLSDVRFKFVVAAAFRRMYCCTDATSRGA